MTASDNNPTFTDVNIDQVIVDATQKLLIDAGWKKAPWFKDMYAKDGHVFMLTPAIAHALWDTYVAE